MNISFQITEFKYILKIAVPLIAGFSTQMIVSLVDAAMVGRTANPEYSLAAMGIGVLATWALVSFFSSLATGTQVLIARNYGCREIEFCGVVLKTSVISFFFIGLIVSVILITASSHIAQFFSKDYVVGQLAGEYLFYRFMGIPFFMVTVAFRGFFFGIGKTKIYMFSGIIVNLLNIIFNYIFIYGSFGFPEMGLAGAGLGSTLATFIDMVYYILIVSTGIYGKKYSLFKNIKLEFPILNNIIKIALPVSFQNIFILVGFLIFIAITGLIGTPEMAASQAVVSALFLSILPCYAFGITAQTLMGQELGKGKIKLALYYGYQTSFLALIYTLFIFLLFYFVPSQVLLLITTDRNIINNAVPLLKIAGAGQILYAFGVVFSFGIQTAGKTVKVMLAELIANWGIFLPAAYFIGVYYNNSIIWTWAALPIYVFFYSLIMFILFRYGNWRTEKIFIKKA